MDNLKVNESSGNNSKTVSRMPSQRQMYDNKSQMALKAYAAGDIPSDDDEAANILSGATSGRKKTD
jgi:hypothetical protein